MERVEFRVRGLTSGGCVRSLTRALRDVYGVQRAWVNLETARAGVEFDAGLTDRHTLTRTVHEAGYTVEVTHPAPPTLAKRTVALPSLRVWRGR